MATRTDQQAMKPVSRESEQLAGWRLMRTCPRYSRCSVPICPLDPDWDLRSHDGEGVCPYLRDTPKPDIAARYKGRPDEHCMAAALELRTAIEAQFPEIARQILDTADNPDLIAQTEAKAGRLAAMREKKGAPRDFSRGSDEGTP